MSLAGRLRGDQTLEDHLNEIRQIYLHTTDTGLGQYNRPHPFLARTQIYPQTVIVAQPPLSALGSKSHPTMVFTLPLLITLFLFGDNQLLVYALQLAMEVPSPESRISGTFVTNLNQCPQLPPRTSPPSSVHDLYVQTLVGLWKP